MCDLCTKQCQPKSKTRPGVETAGTLPFEVLEVDFTEFKPYGGYKYFVVVVCTYLGGAEAYPTHSAQAQEGVKALLRDMIPRYGLPISTGSDTGQALCQG